MFGYILTNIKTLTEEQKLRFRSVYCGMCHSLEKRYGQISRFTLSYDLTFLALVLGAVYESEETAGKRRCPAHPFKTHSYVHHEMIDYAVDINVILSYEKCRDNIADDHSIIAATSAFALKKAYEKAKRSRPEQAAIVDWWIKKNSEIERNGETCVDIGMNLTGEMFAKLFCFRNDFFSSELYRLGENLGRFIYFMDAYEDLEKDIKKKRYNALRSFYGQADYEDFCKASLTMLIAEATDAFEQLPIIQDAELIRNILYSGVWARYRYIQQKKAKAKGVKEQEDAGSV